jgi:hypothetical protein
MDSLFEDQPFNLDLYRSLPPNARNQLEDLLVEFISSSIDKGDIREEDRTMMICTVFPVVNTETKEVHKFIGIKALVDVENFRTNRSKEFVLIMDSTEHNSDLPDELLDIYNKAKEMDISASIVKA